MTFKTLMNELRRRQELNDWLKRQRRDRIEPLPISDQLQQDLNVQTPASTPVEREPVPVPTDDRRPGKTVGIFNFRLAGGLAA